MIVQNEHEEAVLLTYIAADVLDEPDHELMHDLGRWAGLKGPPAQLQHQALAEIRRLWPEPDAGRFGNTSPYLLEVADKRGDKLFCRRGLTDIPEWFLEEVEHFGGIYQPLHVTTVDDSDELRVVAGRKRRGAVLKINRRRFLAWHDAWKAMRSAPILRAPLGEGWEVAPCRLIATVPVMHLSVAVDVCEEILVSENVSHYQATPVDLVFAAHRMKAEGWQIDDIAARLKTSAKTVDNFLALRSLVADGLDALQADTLGLTIAYKLAKLPAGKQRELLRQTAELRGAKRTARIVELLGEAKPVSMRRPDPRQHERWRAVLAARPDPQSALALAVLRHVAGEADALADYPALQGAFELREGDAAAVPSESSCANEDARPGRAKKGWPGFKDDERAAWVEAGVHRSGSATELRADGFRPGDVGKPWPASLDIPERALAVLGDEARTLSMGALYVAGVIDADDLRRVYGLLPEGDSKRKTQKWKVYGRAEQDAWEAAGIVSVLDAMALKAAGLTAEDVQRPHGGDCLGAAFAAKKLTVADVRAIVDGARELGEPTREIS
jgi:hypothetical protein